MAETSEIPGRTNHGDRESQTNALCCQHIFNLEKEVPAGYAESPYRTAASTGTIGKITNFSTACWKIFNEGMMTLRIIFTLLIGNALLLSACTQGNPELTTVSELTTVKEKASYALGQQLAGNLVPAAAGIDEASLVQGIKDTLTEKNPLITPQDGLEALQEYQSVLQQAAADRQNARAEINQKAATDFLAENQKNPNIQVTASGLQYEVLQEGDGANPEATDTVNVHYRGTFLDGTEFDSSYSRGEPVTFPLDRVIPGWTEGLQLMNTGAKYKLFLPPELAYGVNGQGNDIEPNAALIFEVELLGIEK